MSIELSPPNSLLTALDALNPALQQRTSVAGESTEAAPSSLYEVGAADSHSRPDSDPGSMLLTEGFGDGILSDLAMSPVPDIDTQQAVADQAQQWVQYILAAWS